MRRLIHSSSLSSPRRLCHCCQRSRCPRSDRMEVWRRTNSSPGRPAPRLLPPAHWCAPPAAKWSHRRHGAVAAGRLGSAGALDHTPQRLAAVCAAHPCHAEPSGRRDAQRTRMQARRRRERLLPRRPLHAARMSARTVSRDANRSSAAAWSAPTTARHQRTPCSRTRRRERRECLDSELRRQRLLEACAVHARQARLARRVLIAWLPPTPCWFRRRPLALCRSIRSSHSTKAP